MSKYLKDDCLFCKIIRREIPSDIVYEDEFVLAIRDINPLAEQHILVLPKYHIENYYDDLLLHDNTDDFLKDVLANVHLAIAKIIKQEKLSQYGVRVVQNNGIEVGQSVFHIHWHIIAGASADRNLMEYFTDFYQSKERP